MQAECEKKASENMQYFCFVIPMCQSRLTFVILRRFSPPATLPHLPSVQSVSSVGAFHSVLCNPLLGVHQETEKNSFLQMVVSVGIGERFAVPSLFFDAIREMQYTSIALYFRDYYIEGHM